MTRLSQTLAAALHPERYPAPLGRGPDGWPFLPCAVCQRPIPWPTHPRSHLPLPPGYYYRRRFCSRACDHAGDRVKGSPDRRGGIARVVLQWKSRWDLPLATEPEFAQAFPRFDEIRQCQHCWGLMLKEIAIGKQCVYCGTIMYARDGDWAREARVGSVARR